MTTRQELAQELATMFSAEAHERLRSMERDLLALEAGPDQPTAGELLSRLTRDAHSLKGAAQVVALRDVSAVAHALESRLTGMLKASDPAGGSLDPVFDALAAVGRLIDPATAAAVDVAAVVAQLDPDAVRPVVARPRRERRGRPPGPQESPAASLWAGTQPRRDAAGPANQTTADAVTTMAGGEAGEAQAPVSPDSVRVRTTRLDALLARGSELMAVRDRTSDLHAELRRLREAVAGWRRDWQRLRGALEAASGEADASAPSGPALTFAREAGVRLQRLERDLARLVAAAGADRDRIGMLTSHVTSDALELRLVPVATLFEQFPLMVRELARAAGKQVQLQELGWQTEIDRQILEQVKDPVMHLLRNAVDHGIETEAERRAAGKTPVGTIVLEAGQRGGGIVIEVRDDGRGIDPARVRAAALRAGIPESSLPPSSDIAATAALVMRSGVTTADAVTEVSGRGIGLDVVAETVARIGGSVTLESEAGRGMRVSLLLPLTLMIAHVVLVRGHARRYAFPIAAVERCVAIAPEERTEIAGRPALRLGDEAIRLAHLADLVGETSAGGIDPCRTAVVVRSAGATVGFLVGQVIADRQAIARGLGGFVSRAGGAPFVAGAALLGDDDLVLILDPVQLVRAVERGSEGMLPSVAVAATEKEAGRPAAILVVDDSITTRTLEKSILEAAGFAVGVASDGLAALSELRRERYDLVVADVDMPRMDGLELTRRLKAEPATRDVPVILVTALESPEQQEQGLLAGADAYLFKSAFDQRVLLETIRSLVG